MRKSGLLFFALGVFLLGPALSYANKTGNGGDGILSNGQYYLLDLFEYGVQQRPVFQKNINPFLKEKLEPIFESLNLKEPDLLYQKVSEIFELSPSLAWSIVVTANTYSWRLVDRELVDIPDEDSSLNLDGLDLVQLAIRRGQVIRIDKNYWQSLDAANQVALLVHETFYALVMWQRIESKENPGTFEYFQSSPRARDLTGYVFSEELQKRGVEGLKLRAKGWFPISDYEPRYFKGHLTDGVISFDPGLVLIDTNHYVLPQNRPEVARLTPEYTENELKKFIELSCQKGSSSFFGAAALKDNWTIGASLVTAKNTYTPTKDATQYEISKDLTFQANPPTFRKNELDKCKTWVMQRVSQFNDEAKNYTKIETNQ